MIGCWGISKSLEVSNSNNGYMIRDWSPLGWLWREREIWVAMGYSIIAGDIFIEQKVYSFENGTMKS